VTLRAVLGGPIKLECGDPFILDGTRSVYTGFDPLALDVTWLLSSTSGTNVIYSGTGPSALFVTGLDAPEPGIQYELILRLLYAGVDPDLFSEARTTLENCCKTDVSEPSTLAVFGLPLVALVALRLRRQRRLRRD
jgi:hypothetical protein